MYVFDYWKYISKSHASVLHYRSRWNRFLEKKKLLEDRILDHMRSSQTESASSIQTLATQ